MQNIKDNEMQCNVSVRKALRLPGIVERIVSNSTTVDRYEHILAVRSSHKAHVVAKPALYSSTFVIIGTGAFFAVIVTALETVDIELAHICSDSLKVFNKFAV